MHVPDYRHRFPMPLGHIVGVTHGKRVVSDALMIALIALAVLGPVAYAGLCRRI